jgi:hypothetical protein
MDFDEYKALKSFMSVRVHSLVGKRKKIIDKKVGKILGLIGIDKLDM